MAERSESQFQRLVADGIAAHQSGHLRRAEDAYRAALLIVPRHAVITHNLGIVVAVRNGHAAAIRYFDEALAADPRYASAHYNRAVAFAAIGQLRDAIAGFSRACAIEPEHYESHRALGFLWLAEGERGRALDHFARTYELRRGEDRTGVAARSLSSATRNKLLHDAAQFRYLARRHRAADRFKMMAQAYEECGRDVGVETTALSESQLDKLGDDYNTAIHLRDAPELAGGGLNSRPDREGIVRQFNAAEGGAVYFDDLLSPQALASLKLYLTESTIWHDFSHIGGFVGSYLEDGLACPLLLQVAAELRDTFPEILASHPLSQAWAFKGLEGKAAIDVHADDASVSINFWVTPTEANLNPRRGGLTVCRVPPPRDWAVENYHSDRKRFVSFLEQNAKNVLVVPYRENRAVLFESRLFHWSHAPQFAEGYQNHRVNVTLLFGRVGRLVIPTE
jgi:tetratricopeptide (TPR) repeat protein